MAKFHGLGGIRRGSVGNETYYIHKGQNIVKRKNEYYHNPRSVKQQLNRAKMKGCSCLVKMIPLEFLKNTFADKKIIESEYNCFFRHNISTTAPMIKEESDIPNIPGCSINVQISHGTIPTLNSAVLNTGHDNILDLKGGIVLPLNTNVTTVAQVSNVLLQFYPQLKNNDYINTFCYIANGCEVATDNDYDALWLINEGEYVQPFFGRRCFKIDTNNNELISNYGFKIYTSETDLGEEIKTVLAFEPAQNDLYLVPDQDEPPVMWVLSYVSREINVNEWNFSDTSNGYSIAVRDAWTRSQNEKYIANVLESWKVKQAEEKFVPYELKRYVDFFKNVK